MDKTRDFTLLLARVLLALIFIAAGANKVAQYAGTGAYMASVGVPSVVLPAVIALEIGGGLAILLGAMTGPVAIGLALFCVVSGALFHSNFADQVQAVMFMKNLAMAGGFLALAVAGPGALSVDVRLRRIAR